MNRRIWAIIGLIFLGVLVFGAGIVTGQMWGTAVAWQPSFGMMANNNGMINGNMMSNQAAMMNSSGMMDGNMMTHHAAMMGGSGMMNGNMMGMMGSVNADAEITVTAEEAVPLAQAYLDEKLPNSTVGESFNACSGHYAFQVERDGEIVGMIGVSAYTGQVFLHQ